MDTTKLLMLCLVSFSCVFFFLADEVNGCMCQQEHTQTHYCNADFAITARILRKSARRTANKDVYKIEIIKSHKMTEKAERELKHGRIMTATSESMCGVKFSVGRIYVIAGRGSIISLCNFAKPLAELSTVERRGFNGLYMKGCFECKIKQSWRNEELVRQPGVCTWHPNNMCETDFGACVPTVRRGKPTNMCHWRKNPAYQKCAQFP